MYKKIITEIESIDREAGKRAKQRLDSLTKPPGSLGKLEGLAIRLSEITGQVPPEIDKKVHIIMVGDHGVVEEGVSAFPAEVTGQMVKNFLHGGAAINVLTNQVGAELKLVDVGMKQEIECEEILNYRIKKGTDNFTKGPAMSRKEAVSALEAGIRVTHRVIQNGCQLITVGEMGIGNTSPSSAILAVLSDHDLEKIVGPGTGLSPAEVKEKQEIISRAIELNCPNPADPLDVLAKVGGLEIAGMAGCMLASAAGRRPVIIDGFIAGAAALIACNLEPEVSNYLLPSHVSAEPGHRKIYDMLDISPFLDLDMRLGEGTGAVLTVHLVEAALKIMTEMATFAEAGISQ